MEDAKVLVIYWYGKQYNDVKMHQKLLARVGKDCPSYLTVTDWVRKLRPGEDIHQSALEANAYSMIVCLF
jgi:hypothetical protein